MDERGRTWKELNNLGMVTSGSKFVMLRKIRKLDCYIKEGKKGVNSILK